MGTVYSTTTEMVEDGTPLLPCHAPNELGTKSIPKTSWKKGSV